MPERTCSSESEAAVTGMAAITATLRRRRFRFMRRHRRRPCIMRRRALARVIVGLQVTGIPTVGHTGGVRAIGGVRRTSERVGSRPGTTDIATTAATGDGKRAISV